MDAIIMAAGKGTRLMPLTEDKPKAMVMVKGRPIIHWVMEGLVNVGINNIFVITGYREGTLKSYLKYNFEDVSITYIHQKELTGTADAIMLAKDYIKDDFLVVTGDIINRDKDIEYLKVCPNSLLYTELYEKLYQYGTMELRGGIIKSINEKSTEPTSNFVNCSSYHLTKDVFDYIPRTKIDFRFGERIITNTIGIMIDDGFKFRGIPIESLNEISYPEDIEKIEEILP